MEPGFTLASDECFDTDRVSYPDDNDHPCDKLTEKKKLSLLPAWDMSFDLQPDPYQTPWPLFQKEGPPLITTLPRTTLFHPSQPTGISLIPSANNLVPELHDPQLSTVTWHHAATSCSSREPTQSTPALSTADSSSDVGSVSPSIATSSPAAIPTPLEACAPDQAKPGRRPRTHRTRTSPKMTTANTKTQPNTTKRRQPPASATHKKMISEPKRTSLPNPPPESPPAGKQTHKTIEEYKTHMRQWHNKIGKKYRNKLNEQFECLQAVLKVDEHGEDGQSNKHVQGPGGRSINKAKVLDLARQRIEALTKEREALMEERRELVKGLKEKGIVV